ncbi:hypothetical protein JYU23_01305 [bacterium AH-315-C07]|nr:hypothetical protein [bacterium AH-315-C07]
MKRINYILLLLFIYLMYNSGCKPEDDLSWDVKVLAPLISSTLTIQNIMQDSMVQQNSDGSLSLVYQNKIYSVSIDSMIKIPDTTFQKTILIDSLKLSPKQIIHPISLGEVASNAGFVGQLIISSNGSTGIIPPLTGLGANDIDVDANEFFKTATLNKGFMDITIENGWPIDISNLIYQFKNKVSGDIIATGTFAYIPAGDIQTQTVSLAGKTIEGDLLAQIVNIDSPGSTGPVLIDTSDNLTITLKVYDLRPSAATAIFPAQNIIESTDVVPYNLGSAQLTTLLIKEGQVKVEVISTLEDTLYFQYTIESAKMNGEVFVVNAKVNPAPPGDTAHLLKYYDFSGYELDLTGPSGDTVNTFSSSVIGRIDSTGRIVSLSLEDSIFVYTGIVNLIPDYVSGYIGQDTIKAGPAKTDIDIFKKIKGGTLDLSDVELTLSIDNGFGADAVVQINDIQTINNSTSNSISLAGSVLDNPFIVQRATENPLTSAISDLIINNSNANASALIENLPDQLLYDLDIYINPQGNTSSSTGFASADLPISANLDMEFPLSFIADKLTLQDTSKLKLSEMKNSENIIDGEFTFLVDNGFPLEAILQLYVLNDNNRIIDSLITDGGIKSAQVNSSNRVIRHTRSKIKMPLSNSEINTLLSTEKVLVKFSFSTVPANQHLKIYSDYSITLTLTGDFNYRITSN